MATGRLVLPGSAVAGIAHEVRVTGHIVERLRAVVAAHSDACAIACAGEPALTYRAMWERTHGIATQLVAAGIRANDVVALHVERSPEFVVGMLATWLAGAAWVPVLPELPESRRQLIIDETNARVALVGADRSLPGCRSICLGVADASHRATSDGSNTNGARSASVASNAGPDHIEHPRLRQGRASVALNAGPDHLEHPRSFADRVVDRPSSVGVSKLEGARSIEDRAYVIYTSGSTGQPKGVVVSHRGLVPMLDAQIAAFDLRAGDRCLWMLSPGFDASVSDVGTALLAGATLHIEHPARLRSASGLLDLIRQRGITHVDLPPSLLPLLPVEPPPSLRTIIVGGEVCAPAAIRAWVPHVRVVNVYGPTEATVCTSLIACDAQWDRPLLGAALPHVEYAVVDDELWITGPGVADGYLARPELDAAKFVWRDDRRWFRTGDRVRVHERASGAGTVVGKGVRNGDAANLEFVGRIDRQLKIAGVLVAPEEIEARLREHPAVRDAHVVAERVGNRERLVAYYVDEPDGNRPARTPAHVDEPDLNRPARSVRIARSGAHVDKPDGNRPTPPPADVANDLRDYLARHLDARLLPSQFTRVDNLGFTKRAVAGLARDPSISSSSRPSRPSRRSRDEGLHDPGAPFGENQLRAIWWRLLGIEPDPDDDFFELGGDSLAVIEHVGLAELAGLPMTAEMLYEHRTLRAVANAIERGEGARAMTCDELRDDISPLARQRALDIATGEAATSGRNHFRASDVVATATPRMATTHVAAESSTGQPATIGQHATSGVASTSEVAGASEVAATFGTTAVSATTIRLAARPASILLTGATGFLGSHVLVELLARTDASITCLVRDPAKLESALRRVGDGHPVTARVRVIVADLEHLPDDLYADTIIHCAADLSLAKPYHALRATNALGTARILGRGTRVHYASTLSVFVGSDRIGTHRETDALETAERLHGGYAQSKWAAEWLARDAGATIYRFGLLTGDTRTGRAPPRDWLTWFIRGIARIGAVPHTGELRVDITPIDHAARALAQLALDDARGTFHVANRQSATLADLVAVIRRAGIAVEEVEPARWPAIIGATPLDTPALAASMLGLCRGTDRYARARACDVFAATDHAFDTTRVDELVGPCPAPTAALLDRYVAFALESR